MAVAAPSPAAARAPIPYAQPKNRRGRKKTIDTRGYACPYPGCPYFNNPDPAMHALVAYGHLGRHDRIQDFFCQACQRKFSARRHTAIYGLKTEPAQVAQALQAVAEGLSPHAAARVFNLSEASIRLWLTRAGLYSRNLHGRFLRSLHFSHSSRFHPRSQHEPNFQWQAGIATDGLLRYIVPAAFLLPNFDEYNVRVVYSPLDSLKIARENPDQTVVFFGIGFETTAPAICAQMEAPDVRVNAFLGMGNERCLPA